MPSKKEWVTFAEWGKKWGALVLKVSRATNVNENNQVEFVPFNF